MVICSSMELLESKVSSEYDDHPRVLFKVPCKGCSKELWLPKHVLTQGRYCSKPCFLKFRVTKSRNVECARCKAPVFVRASRIKQSKSGLFFCSKQCKDASQGIGGLIALDVYGTGACSYRARALKAFGAKCKICGYLEKVKMLDVDHIDSNRGNNVIENLQVLCVWCHAEKTRRDWPDE